MFRILLLVQLLTSPVVGWAGIKSPFYQVDMIVFTHLTSSNPDTEQELLPLIPPSQPKGIPLQSGITDALLPYQLLPDSTSDLKNEYWVLKRKPQYQVLGHYSWLQPGNNQRPVILPTMNDQGWSVDGTIRIRQSNYYLLNAELLFSSLNNNLSSFVFSQKQRLKDGQVYYLDHPQAGLLIKVHKVA